MPDPTATLSHVLAEVKRYGLGERVTRIEVGERGIVVEMGSAGGKPPNDTEIALNHKREFEDLMYGSSGGTAEG